MQFAADLKANYQSGRRAVITSDLARDAQAAKDLLKPFGVSLYEAARTYAKLRQEEHGTETFATRYDAYVARQEMDWSAAYADQMARLPRWLGKEFLALPIGRINDQVIRDALRAQGAVAEATIESRARRVRAVISGKGHRRRAVRIEIMTLRQVALMMRACQQRDELRAVALLLFAGIRPGTDYGEIARLDWESIDDDHVYVPAEASKTGSDRHIPMTPRLRRLLRGHPSEGPVTPAGWARRIQRIRKAAGIAGKQDITRHTFASHYLAAFGEDATKAAMGHTPNSRTLFAHYRKSVTVEQGLAYFGER